MAEMNLSVFGKFISKISFGSEKECWNWNAGVGSHGYGVFSVNRRSITAPRYMMTLLLDHIPDGEFVCHSCDNRKCVNPYHLFLGTNAENLKDMRNKKRHCYGVKHPGAKLSEEKVRLILGELDKSITQKVVAKKYGISAAVVARIGRGEVWKHVKRPSDSCGT